MVITEYKRKMEYIFHTIALFTFDVYLLYFSNIQFLRPEKLYLFHQIKFSWQILHIHQNSR